jgi:hypothetical protein
MKSIAKRLSAIVPPYILFALMACTHAPVEGPKVEQKPARTSPYPRIEADLKRPCWVTQSQDDYDVRYIFDCRKDYSPSSRYFAGYGIRSRGNHPFTSTARSPYRNGKVARTIDMVSRNLALNETYLSVIDFAGGPDSHDPKSSIFLFPRVALPALKEGRGQLELTLPTGEKAYFSTATGALVGGVLKEGPIDLNPNHRSRRPPNVRYTGDFVSVELTQSYDEPTVSAVKAIVRQREATCVLNRTDLFSKDGRLLPRNDDEVLDVINRLCPERFDF